ncbi:MAG TPA: DinB family protein [Anaerolineales bacterium]|nr:DinB family protein [Anaerolineales bacterium]
MDIITPPSTDEYNEFYNDYIQRAKDRNDLFVALSLQIEEIKSGLGDLTDGQALFRDVPGEWSIKEVMGHLNDVERVFAYRLLCVSRNDPTPLPGMEQDDYVREAGYDQYALGDLITEFEHLRRANILAIQNMNEEIADRRGTASGFPVSVRALIYMLVGHIDHHMASLYEKYLPTAVTL